MQAEPFDAFLSYASQDRRQARWIHRFLQSYRPKGAQKPLRVYWDQTDIRGGHLAPELEEALARSRHLVVCCSYAAADSQWVAAEIASFRKLCPGRPIALLLLSGDPARAVPEPARELALRYHDLRRGRIFWRYVPANRDELLRLLALLSGQDLRLLINWQRRRLLASTMAIAAGLGALSVGTYSYVQNQREATPADVTARVALSDAEYDSDDTVGQDLARLFSSSTTLKIVGAPAGPAQGPMQVKWPFQSHGVHAYDAPLKLTSGAQDFSVERQVSVDGQHTISVRTFKGFSGTLGPLKDRRQWRNARFEARFESVVPHGTKLPQSRDPKDLAEHFNARYKIGEQERELYQDYRIGPLPIRARLELYLNGVVVAKSEGYVARVWEWDEDVRNLHVVYFPAQEKGAR